MRAITRKCQSIVLTQARMFLTAHHGCRNFCARRNRRRKATTIPPLCWSTHGPGACPGPARRSRDNSHGRVGLAVIGLRSQRAMIACANGWRLAMTKVNHELSIDELGVISGGGLKSAFDKLPDDHRHRRLRHRCAGLVEAVSRLSDHGFRSGRSAPLDFDSLNGVAGGMEPNPFRRFFLRPHRNQLRADRTQQQLVRAIDDFVERAGARKHRLRLRQQFVARRNPRMERRQYSRPFATGPGSASPATPTIRTSAAPMKRRARSARN